MPRKCVLLSVCFTALAFLPSSLIASSDWVRVGEVSAFTGAPSYSANFQVPAASLLEGQLRFAVTLGEQPITDGLSGRLRTDAWHSAKIALNGETVFETEIFSGSLPVLFDLRASTTLVAGTNSLTITRTDGDSGTSLPGRDLQIELFAAGNTDSDSDGLPLYWEQENGFDPSLPDAAGDFDGDGLDALQEFLAGTEFTRADTDGDGLLDGDEIARGLDPLAADSDGDGLSDYNEIIGASDPLAIDTDGDGSPDGWESWAGLAPDSPGETPPEFSGIIGLQFISTARPAVALDPLAIAGPVPQMNWNTTAPLPGGATSGDNTAVATPSSGVLSFGDGSISPVDFSWQAAGTSTTGSAASLNGQLLGDYLYGNAESGTPVSLDFDGIPFPTYDVYVLISAPYSLLRGKVEVLEQPGSEVRAYASKLSPRRLAR